MVTFTAEILNGKLNFLCSELLDRNTRKILTCNGLFHPHANAARLSLKRCEGRRRLISVKDCITSQCNELWDYLEKSEEPMLKEVDKEDFIMEKEGKKECDRRNKEKNETNWEAKSLHENFPKSIADFADSVSW